MQTPYKIQTSEFDYIEIDHTGTFDEVYINDSWGDECIRFPKDKIDEIVEVLLRLKREKL